MWREMRRFRGSRQVSCFVIAPWFGALQTALQTVLGTKLPVLRARHRALRNVRAETDGAAVPSSLCETRTRSPRTYFEYAQKSRLPIAVMTLSPQTLASVNSERARCFRPGLRMARRQRRRETADRRLQDRVGWWPSARCGASTLPPLPPLAAAVEACAPGSYLVASDPCGVLHRKQALGSMMQSLVVLLELSTRIGAPASPRVPRGPPRSRKNGQIC